MDRTNFNKLNNLNQKLVNKIESQTRCEVEVVVVSKQPHLSCTVELNKIQIQTPEDFIFSDESIWHELNHILRVCTMEVPTLEECPNTDGADFQIAMQLRSFDNDMEHLVIVPEEIKLFPHRAEEWEDKVRNALDKNNGRVSGEMLLRHWLFVNHVLPKSDLVGVLKKLVDETKIQKRADEILEIIPPLIANKEELVRAYFEHASMPIKNLCFEYFDFKNKEKSYISF